MGPIKFHMKNAKESYEELRAIYDQLPKGLVCKVAKRQMRAQMTVHAGIYNRDYAQYKKGVDAFETHGMEVLQASMPRIMVSDNLASKNGDGSAIDESELQRFYERKLESYKKLYTVLPRGYFKQ